MEMIEQSVTSYKQEDFTLEGAYKAVERAARICYNSTDKITNDSYKPFIKMLRKNKHTAPFAFGTIHLYFPAGISIGYGKKYHNKITEKTMYTHSFDILDFFDKLPDNWARVSIIDYNAYVTVNLRVLEEWEVETNANSDYPLGFTGNREPIYKKVKYKYDLLDVVKPYMINESLRFEPRPFVICTTSIAMSREYNRYSSLSICERSTRYVEANQIIKPYWYNENKDNSWYFEDIVQIELDAYNSMLKEEGIKTLTKQQARDILPLCTVTEVAYIGFQDDWDWIIKQRTGKGAHPQAQELAGLIEQEIYG